MQAQMLLIRNGLQRNLLAVVSINILQDAVQPFVIVGSRRAGLYCSDREITNEVTAEQLHAADCVTAIARRFLIHFLHDSGQIAANSVIPRAVAFALNRGIAFDQSISAQPFRIKLPGQQHIILLRSLDLMNRHAVNYDDIVLMQNELALIDVDQNRALKHIDHFDFFMPMEADMIDAVDEQLDGQIVGMLDKFVQITNDRLPLLRNIIEQSDILIVTIRPVGKQSTL